MTVIRDIQQQIQNQAYNAWLANPRSFLEMATGTGKTWVAIMIIESVVKKNPNAKILIIVPRELIRDRVFPDDFKKFGKAHLLANCTIECIQTVYKWVSTDWELVVADEAHNYLPNGTAIRYEYFKFFENNVYKYFLGLSATIDSSLKAYQYKIGPTVFTYTISQAAKDGVVSAFRFVNLCVSLTPEEEKEYKTVQKNYNYYEHLLGGSWEAYNNAKLFKIHGNSDQKTWANIFWGLIKKRKSLLDKASNKFVTARLIMNLFPESNGILFSDSIESATGLVLDNPNCVVYHSKLKKKEKLEAIRLLEDGRTRIRWISAVKALNEGVSINNLEIGIETSGTSKPKDTIQRLGRCVRFIESKKPIFVRLYIKGTQDEKWLRRAQKDFDQSCIFWCNNLDEFKTIINS